MTLAPLLALALAVPLVEVEPLRASPGDAVLVTVQDELPPHATLLGRPLHFYPAGPGRWQALGPVPLDAAAGPARLEVAGAPPAGLEIGPARWRSTTLTVPSHTLDPPASARARLAADAAALNKAYAQPFRPPLYAGGHALPRRSETTGGFGDRRVYNGKTSGVHNGLDLDGRRGDPITASADGTVVLARDCYLSGGTTILWHGGGLYTVYLHQHRMEVRAGEQVRRGQRIGQVGSTGRSTGPHLHWGARLDGVWVNPESLVRLTGVTGPEAEPDPGTVAAAAAEPEASAQAEVPPAPTPAPALPDPAAAPAPSAAPPSPSP